MVDAVTFSPSCDQGNQKKTAPRRLAHLEEENIALLACQFVPVTFLEMRNTYMVVSCFAEHDVRSLGGHFPLSQLYR